MKKPRNEELYQKCRQQLINQIRSIERKLDTDETLTEGQYGAIQGILIRKKEALKEDRVY